MSIPRCSTRIPWLPWRSCCGAGAIDAGEAEILVTAATLYHALTQCLRLCLDKPFVPEEAPRALKELLARASEMPDFATLEAKLRETLAAVHELFERIVVQA